MSSDPSRYEFLDVERRLEHHDQGDFDRIAFAMRTLRRLRPARMTIAVYERHFDLRIERGRDVTRGPGASWAMVGIPPHSSREHIAYALAELAGVASVPFAVALLLSADERDPA